MSSSFFLLWHLIQKTLKRLVFLNIFYWLFHRHYFPSLLFNLSLFFAVYFISLRVICYNYYLSCSRYISDLILPDSLSETHPQQNSFITDADSFANNVYRQYTFMLSNKTKKITSIFLRRKCKSLVAYNNYLSKLKKKYTNISCKLSSGHS